MKYFIFFIVFGISVLTVSSVYAQSSNRSTSVSSVAVSGDEVWSCDQLRNQINEYGSGRAAALPNTICKVSDLYDKAINFFYYFLGIIAVLMLVYGGFTYMTARDNEAQKKKGKDILLYTILGLVIALLAAWIVGLIIAAVVDNKIF